MTPNFALSLSFDGIRLMHRVSGGWHLVGEAALDDPDLTGTLAALRKTALSLEPSGLRTKILLPNEQIKYLSIDTTQTSVDDIHSALQGATPYDVNDLVIDFNRSGGRTHVAAVARETLAEAEGFASQHKFAPVTFAAVAEPFTFNTEVFFGMADAAPAIVGDGVVIDRDDTPVSVIGHVKMPEPPAVPEAMPLTTQEVVPEIAPEIADVAPAPQDITVAEDQPAPEGEAIEEPVLSFARSAWRDAPEPEETEPDPEPEVATEQPQAPPAEPILPEIEEPMFTSRLRAEPEVATPPAPVVAPEIDDLPPEPLFTRRRDTPLTPGIADVDVAEPDAPAVPRPIIAAQPSAPEPAPMVAAAPEQAPVQTSAAAPAARTGLAAAAGGMLAKRQARRREKAKATALPPGVGSLGGKHATQVGGKPKYLGLMLTFGLIVFLALVALWASTLSENGIAGLFGYSDEPVAVAAPAPDVETPTEPVAPQIVATAPQTETTTPTTPIVTTVPGRVLSPGEADRIYAATGVWQRAPRLPILPEAATLDGLRLIAAPKTVPPVSQPLDLARTAQVIEAPFPAPPNPAPAGTVIPRDDNGFILASANGTVMPNGVLVYARAPRITPPARPGAAVVPEVEAPAVAVPEVTPPEPDVTADVTPEAPTPDDATAALDATAATIAAALAATTVAPVAPEADAAVEGLNLITGRPDIAPPLRPDAIVQAALTVDEDSAETDPVEETDLAAVADASLAGLRPSVRPAGLVPEAPYADPQLAGLRPSVRPADLAPPVEEAPPEDDESVEEAVAAANASPDLSSVIATIAAAAPPSALVNPTRQAIVASPRPDTRPNNFSRVVASAQARQQQPAAAASTQTTRASAPAVASSAAAAPTGSVPRSVAAAATQADTINLRNVNLIGVYGRPNNRRALVRLANGSYVKVEVGTSFQGGRITVIGDSALNYVVGGQTYSLQVPAS